MFVTATLMHPVKPKSLGKLEKKIILVTRYFPYAFLAGDLIPAICNLTRF